MKYTSVLSVSLFSKQNKVLQCLHYSPFWFLFCYLG